MQTRSPTPTRPPRRSLGLALIVVFATSIGGCGTATEGQAGLDSELPEATQAPTASAIDVILDRCEDIAPERQAVADPPLPEPIDPEAPMATPSPISTPAVQVREDEVAALGQWAQRTYPETFGGYLVDGDSVVLQTTADPDELAAAAAARTDLPIRIEVVDHTAVEVEAARRALDGIAMGSGPIDEGEGVVNGFGIGGFNRVMVDVIGDPAAVTPELVVRVGEPGLLCLNGQSVPGPADAGPVTWQVDPGWTPNPAATEIPLLVTEQACAGGTSAEGRIVVRQIEVTREVVTVDVVVIPLGGAQTCPSNPATLYTLTLDQPIGDRELAPAAGQTPDETMTAAPPPATPPSTSLPAVPGPSLAGPSPAPIPTPS